MLVISPQLGGSGGLVASVGRAVVEGALLLGAIVVLGMRLSPKVLRLVAAWASRELFLVAVVAIGVAYPTVRRPFGAEPTIMPQAKIGPSNVVGLRRLRHSSDSPVLVR